MMTLSIFLTSLLFVFPSALVLAKFGEAPHVKGLIKCCFGKGGGFLSGRCLEMSEADCTLKRGVVVKDCRECVEQEGGKRQKR
jgi:hypothetical protein